MVALRTHVYRDAFIWIGLGTLDISAPVEDVIAAAREGRDTTATESGRVSRWTTMTASSTGERCVTCSTTSTPSGSLANPRRQALPRPVRRR